LTSHNDAECGAHRDFAPAGLGLDSLDLVVRNGAHTPSCEMTRKGPAIDLIRDSCRHVFCDNRAHQRVVDVGSLIELCTHHKSAYELLGNVIDCSRETLDRSVSALSNDKSIASQNAGDRDPNSNGIASEVDHVIESVSELIADLLREMRCCEKREVSIDPRE
jgi:hypothetical protein